MVVNLSLSNCRLLGFGLWQRSRSDMPHGGPLEISLRPPKTNEPTGGKFCQVFLPGPSKQRPHRRQGLGPENYFEKLGLFTINLEILSHFRDLNDRTLSDHLHEDYDISNAPW
ncbi:hypothetical protein TNCV_4671211 [Trichonephila clavipes]|nr:hypothetical protein TNCV_4671211 [Trichonephila clavipes]